MEKYLLQLIVLIPIIGGLINYFISKKIEKTREIIAIIISIVTFGLALVAVIINPLEGELFALNFKADGFKTIYGLIASFMWACTLIFSKEYMTHYKNKDRYYLFYLLTLGATLGVFYSKDLLTTFMFFEMMSFASFVLVIHDEEKETLSASKTYLVITIITGMILLMGLFVLQSELKTLNMDSMYHLCKDGNITTKTYIAGILLLVGFGAKAGMYPLHIWLPKAHAVAPAPASALLSGILTKTGVYGIIVIVTTIFASVTSFAIILLVIALITMLLGAILGVFSVNIKRTLACSSMSQIGFILTGLSMLIFLNGNEAVSIAFEGSFMHMVNHSLIKLSLFMIVGVMVMNTHKLNLNELKGFGRNKYVLMILFAISALSIMGIPFFGGYISKTLIHESIVEFIHILGGGYKTIMTIVEYSFLFAGGLTIAYMLKLFVCVFIEKNNNKEIQRKYDEKKKAMSIATTIVIILATIMLPLFAIVPSLTANNLMVMAASFFRMDEHHLHFVNYYTWVNLKGSLISIAIGLVAYFGFVRTILIRKNDKGCNEYVDIWPKWLDLQELVYRPVVYSYKNKESFNVVTYTILFVFRSLSEIMDGAIYFVRKYILRQYKYKYCDSPLTYRIGYYIDRHKKCETPSVANRMLEKHIIIKNVHDTLHSTFSFGFLMACIGVVTILILMLI